MQENTRATGSVEALTRRGVIAAAAAAMVTVNRLGSAETAPRDEKIIDVHAHIISKDPQRYPPAPLRRQMSVFARNRLTFEEYIAQENSAGVTKAAIVQVSTYFRIDNSHLADSVAKDPKRFIGVCSIDTIAPGAVKVLDDWIQRGGFGVACTIQMNLADRHVSHGLSSAAQNGTWNAIEPKKPLSLKLLAAHGRRRSKTGWYIVSTQPRSLPR